MLGRLVFSPPIFVSHCAVLKFKEVEAADLSRIYTLRTCNGFAFLLISQIISLH